MLPRLVVGIGNILLSDDGVGVRVIEELRRQDLPADVEVADGGTQGADLVDLFADRELAVVVDAVQAQIHPGAVLALDPDDLARFRRPKISLHEIGIVETLRMTRLLGCAPRRVRIIGVQPAHFAFGMSLSPEVERAIPLAIRAVLSELQAGAAHQRPAQTVH